MPVSGNHTLQGDFIFYFRGIGLKLQVGFLLQVLDSNKEVGFSAQANID